MRIWNTFKVTILLATLTGLLIVTGSALGGQTGMVIAFGLAIVMNMGAWWFMRSRLEAVVGKPVKYIGRNPAASPATGFPPLYRKQQMAIPDEAVGKLKN